MFRLFQSIFGSEPPEKESPYPEDIVRRAIEREVDVTDTPAARSCRSQARRYPAKAASPGRILKSRYRALLRV